MTEENVRTGTHLRRREHIDLHGIGTIFRSGICLEVDEQNYEDRNSLDGGVDATQVQDDFGIFAVQLSRCQHYWQPGNRKDFAKMKMVDAGAGA